MKLDAVKLLFSIWLEKRFLKAHIYKILVHGCAISFNGGPNTNKHNILRASPLNRVIFYPLLILPAIKIKLQ